MAARVDLEVDKGADYTMQMVWSDVTDNPVPVVEPMRMDVKSPYGQVMFSLFVPVSPPPGEIPAITYNTDSGLIQVHMTKEQTDMLEGGTYAYDLFVTVDDGDVGTGDQLIALMYGNVNVRPRTTMGI